MSSEHWRAESSGLELGQWNSEGPETKRIRKRSRTAGTGEDSVENSARAPVDERSPVRGTSSDADDESRTNASVFIATPVPTIQDGASRARAARERPDGTRPLLVEGTGQRRCKAHPQAPASWRCERCRALRCDQCAQPRSVDGVRIAACPCGGRCDAYEPPAVVARDDVCEDLAGSFAWPLLGSSPYFLISVCGLYFLANLGILNRYTMNLPFLLFTFLSLFLCCTFFLHVVRQSALDPRAELEFPDFDSFWDSVIVPTFRFAGCLGFYLAPAFLMAKSSPLGGIALAALGAYFLPMAILSLAVRDEIRAMGPLVVLRSTRRVPSAAYWTLVLGFFGLVLLRFPLAWLLSIAPWIGSLLGFPISIYLACVQLRLLGVFYRRHAARLRWF